VATSSTQFNRRPGTIPALLPALLLALAGAACEGPPLSLSTDGPRYVDGRSESRTELPFRYYGTMVVDVLPADLEDGAPNWTRWPVRGRVELPAPAAPWLFPLDLPIELIWRGFGLVPALAAEVDTVEAAEPVVTGYLPGGIPALRQRARAARSDR